MAVGLICMLTFCLCGCWTDMHVDLLFAWLLNRFARHLVEVDVVFRAEKERDVRVQEDALSTPREQTSKH